MNQDRLTKELPAYARYRDTSGVRNLQISKSGMQSLRNPWSRRPGFFNLTAQMEITRRDPALAERLQAEALDEDLR